MEVAPTRPLWKRALVIDDTQKFPGPAARLAERANNRLKVIRATTDFGGETPGAFQLPSKAAVTALASEMRRRRAEILPIVRRCDSQVGDGYLDIPLERRIEAAEEANTPWQFAYILRGGWSQARRALDNLRDINRTDQLLFCIAVRQIVSLDAGCTPEEATVGVARLGGDPASVGDGLDLLRRQRAILPGMPIRCPHIQAAIVVLRRFLTDRRDPLFPSAVSLLRSACIDNRPPLRGVSWLLSELYFTDAFRGLGDFPSPEDIKGLVQRCCGALAGVERRDAAFLLSTLLGHRTSTVQALKPYHDVLRGWIEKAEGVSAYALASMINNLYNAEKTAMQLLVGSAEPCKIAGCLAGACTAEGYAWGHLLDRLSLAGNEWRTAMKAVLPADSIRTLAATFKPSEIGHLNGYLEGVAAINENLATECLTAAMPTLKAAFLQDPVEAFSDIDDIRWRILGQHPFGEGTPNGGQRRLSKTMTDVINPGQTVAAMCSCRYGDWERYARLLYWLRQINPRKHRAIVEL
jgi:hypothetical protein